jgi:hypothetical protein
MEPRSGISSYPRQTQRRFPSNSKHSGGIYPRFDRRDKWLAVSVTQQDSPLRTNDREPMHPENRSHSAGALTRFEPSVAFRLWSRGWWGSGPRPHHTTDPIALAEMSPFRPNQEQSFRVAAEGPAKRKVLSTLVCIPVSPQGTLGRFAPNSIALRKSLPSTIHPLDFHESHR